ncbi:MAG: septum formation initiator family protein [Calditerrivibrio sp.]|nr:septum formation initiator family protein [Calditerrivibrio sp.]
MKHILFLLILAGLLAYLTFGNNGLLQYRDLVKIREKYRKESMEYDLKISKLKEEIELLKNDRDYLEMVIKKELNFKKKDEDLFIILGKDEAVYSNRDNQSSKKSN